MKTALEWFNTIEDQDVRKKAIANIDEGDKDRIYKTLSVNKENGRVESAKIYKNE